MVRSISSNRARREDRQIFTLLRLGDPDAVAYWLQTYEPRLYKHLLAKVGNPQDAQELTQDTFMSCLRHLPLFRGDAMIWTWMVAVARHEVADYFRKKYAKKALQLLPLSEFLLATKLETTQEIAEQVGAALSHMSHSSRELLLEKYVDGKRVAMIAREQNQTEKAVESQLYRARIEFREQYAEAAAIYDADK